MEHGITLVGKALVNRNLNKWGIQNVLRVAWKDLGDIQIKWVWDNTFIINVLDETAAQTILTQVPWAVMKQNFSIQ